MHPLLVRVRSLRSDAWLIAGYWTVVAPILLVQYHTDNGGNWPLALAMAATSVVLDTVAVLVVVQVLLPLFLRQRFKPALGLLLVFLMVSSSSYRFLYGMLRGYPLEWNARLLLIGAVAHAKSYGLLAVLLTGKRYFEGQRRLLLAQQTQTETELRNLKSQLDPHFLFNNLNVLRGLIVQDAAAAQAYLDRLAGLYRFLIRYQNEDFVLLSEELDFVAQYVFLLQQRFGQAYTFRQELDAATDPAAWLVVPGTVQLLVENAVKHNAGDEDHPLSIVIGVQEATLTVQHARRPKQHLGDATGTGLRNLSERYRLLLGQAIRVEPTAAAFAVHVPLVGTAGAPAQR